jgi:hypothetical protein
MPQGGTLMHRALIAALVCALGATGLAGQKPRDLSKLDACKILPAADVASTLKRKIMKTVGGETHCMYVPADPQSVADAYDFYLQEASLVEALLQMQKGPEKGSPVPGLWTEAYVGPATGTPNLLSLVALKKGDMAIEIKGMNKDGLIALARLAVSRLQ